MRYLPRIALGGVEVGKMRYFPHIAIGAGVLVCAAIAYYAFSGKTPAHQAATNGQGYSENSYCRVVSFNEKAKNGTAGPCLRCVTGTYTATSWTNCPVRESSDQPGSVECGYNAGQTPTAIDPATMCADTSNGQPQPAAGNAEPPPAGGAVPDSGNIASSGGNTPAPTGTNPNDIRGVPNGGGTASGPAAPPATTGSPNIPNTSSGSGGGVVITRTREPAPPAGANNPTFNSGAQNGGGYLGISLPRGQHRPARVLAVAPGGGAALAGIKPGDLIESIEGIPIDYGEDILDILARFHPRDHVQIEVSRGEQTYSVSAVLGARPASNAGGPASTGGATSGGAGAAVLRVLGQQEARDYWGHITQEAATVRIVACNGSGRQVYIYQYLNRPGFRAILPPDFGHALGGRDFATYDEAVRAGCGG